MLVLSRQINEAITIGDEIEISVIEIKGGKVRIGINAPRNIAVYRKEVYLEIKAQNLAAASQGTDMNELDQLFNTKLKNRLK
ncbi:carbon storage regulator CsrA [Desulforegula conservatrix]|uniref:carbon storage regulator CsrA n=1 Tax=Desulforegula conservatrix TaxID=153026 RepID=UPI00042877AC|nr:carbon storage regulator CsrA [Desulforegula conservatrix]